MTLSAMLASSLSTPLINALIPLGFGIYLTLVGFDLLPVSSDKKSQAARARWTKHGRIGGPLLIVVGLFFLARALF